MTMDVVTARRADAGVGQLLANLNTTPRRPAWRLLVHGATAKGTWLR